MKNDDEFRRHVEKAFHNLERLLTPLGDEYGFEVRVGPGGLEVEFDPAQDPITVTVHPAHGQVWLASGPAVSKLTWDVVENAFVLEATDQTLQELLEEAISERVGDDVSL